MSKIFEGRVAIITGGSDGIGLATARLLAERGATVAVCARRPEQLAKAQADITAAGGRKADITAGGGQVSLTMNGKYEVQKVEIKPEVVDPEDVEILEDLLAAAVNEAVRVVRETQDNEMNGLTGNFNLPSGFSL